MPCWCSAVVIGLNGQSSLRRSGVWGCPGERRRSGPWYCGWFGFMTPVVATSVRRLTGSPPSRGRLQTFGTSRQTTWRGHGAPIGRGVARPWKYERMALIWKTLLSRGGTVFAAGCCITGVPWLPRRPPSGRRSLASTSIVLCSLLLSEGSRPTIHRYHWGQDLYFFCALGLLLWRRPGSQPGVAPVDDLLVLGSLGVLLERLGLPNSQSLNVGFRPVSSQ